MGVLKKTNLEKFKEKVEEKVKKAKEIEKKEVKKLSSPLPKIIIAGAVILLAVLLMQYFPQLRESLEITNIIKILKTWWTYPIAAVILFLFLLSLKRFVKKTFTIEGEEEKIVEEVNELLEKEKNLKKEEKKIKKEIEVLVGKTLELFELSKERKEVKKKGKKLQEALKKPFKEPKDVRRVLKIMDDLLAKLPEKELEKFARSEAAKLYEKVMKRYGIQ